jgi:phage shock protein A
MSKLIQENDSYLKQFLGGPSDVDIETLKHENEDLKRKVEELQQRIEELTAEKVGYTFFFSWMLILSHGEIGCPC